MAAVSGGEFLSYLFESVERHRGELVSGRIPFTLNPTCLAYLNDKLGEFERDGRRRAELGGGARSERYVRVMTTLGAFVREQPLLRVEPEEPEFVEEQQVLDLRRFRALETLELVRCRAYLVDCLRSPALRVVRAHRALQSLHELLEPPAPSLEDVDAYDAAPSGAAPWAALLVELDCSRNALRAMDTSLRVLTSLKRLKLTHNRISAIRHLQDCVHLRHLDLSHNKIDSLEAINTVVGNLAVLSLHSNALTSIAGLEKMYSLERLDVSSNLLVDFAEVARLSNLPLLAHLRLAGNPLSVHEKYRQRVLSYFSAEVLETLDGYPFEPYELKFFKNPDEPDVPILRAPRSPNTIPNLGKLSSPQASSSSSLPSPCSSLPSPSSSLPSQSSSLPSQSSSLPSSSLTSQTLLKQSPPVVRSNRRKKNVVVFESDQSTNTTDTFPLPELMQASDTAGNLLDTEPMGDAETRRMLERVEALRKESGHKWLLVLNHELEQQAPREQQIINEKKQLTLKRAVAQTKMQISAANAMSSVRKINSDLIKRSHRSDSDDEKAADEKPADSDDEPVDDEKAPAKEKRGGVVESENDEAIRQIEEATAFFTVTMLDGGETRILLLGPSYLVEADQDGRYAVSHEVKYLDDAEYWGQSEGRPVVKVVFAPPRADGGARNDRTQVAGYIMQDEAEKDALLDILRGIVAQNSKSKLICLHCSGVFSRPPGGLPKCPECGHTVLVQFEEPAAAATGGSAMSSSSGSDERASGIPSGPSGDSLDVGLSARFSRMLPAVLGGGAGAPNVGGGGGSDAAVEYGESVRAAQDAAPDSMDVNMQLYFRLNFFSGEASDADPERFVYLFSSDFVRYGARMEDVLPGFLLLTNLSLYLLVRNRKPTGTDPGYRLLHAIPLSELRRLVRGPNFQYFRLEHQRRAFVYFPRDHRRTHRFVDLIAETLPARDGVLTSPTSAMIDALNVDVLAANAVTVQRRTNGNFVHGYFLVFYGRAAPRRLLSGRDSALQFAMRSFVLTNEHLVLANEDLAKYPRFEGARAPPTPWFEPIAVRALRDVVAVELHPGTSPRFCIVFDDETTGIDGPDASAMRWELMSESLFERSRLVEVLSQMWKSLFRLPLTVTDADV